MWTPTCKGRFVTAVYRTGLGFWLVGTGRASSQISHKDLTRGQGSAKAGHRLPQAMGHSTSLPSSPLTSQILQHPQHSDLLLHKPVSLHGCQNPSHSQKKGSTAPSQGWSLGANTPTLQQELGLSPREGEAPPRALSSSTASLRGSYPTLSPHLTLPAPSGLLTTPAQTTAGIRCLPPANFHPGHYPQLLEATFTSGPSAPGALTEGGRKPLQPAQQS